MVPVRLLRLVLSSPKCEFDDTDSLFSSCCIVCSRCSERCNVGICRTPNSASSARSIDCIHCSRLCSRQCCYSLATILTRRIFAGQRRSECRIVDDCSRCPSGRSSRAYQTLVFTRTWKLHADIFNFGSVAGSVETKRNEERRCT